MFLLLYNFIFNIEREHAPTEFSAVTFTNFLLHFKDFESIVVRSSGVSEIVVDMVEFSGNVDQIIDAPDLSQFQLN